MAEYRRPQKSKSNLDPNTPKVGPITQFVQAKEYLDTHSVPVMLQSLIASLMIERPENHFDFIEAKLEAIKEIGLENVDWEAFIYHLHPLRDPIRNEYIKEDKDTDKEPKDRAPFADFDEERPEAAESLVDLDDNYKAETFITEAQDDAEDDLDVPINLDV